MGRTLKERYGLEISANRPPSIKGPRSTTSRPLSADNLMVCGNFGQHRDMIFCEFTSILSWISSHHLIVSKALFVPFQVHTHQEIRQFTIIALFTERWSLIERRFLVIRLGHWLITRPSVSILALKRATKRSHLEIEIQRLNQWKMASVTVTKPSLWERWLCS